MINPWDKLYSYSRQILDSHDPNRRKLAAWLIILFILLILLAVYFSAQRNALQQLRNVADLNMTRLSNNLNAALERHEYLPEVLARNQAIRHFIDRKSQLSRYQMGIYLKDLGRVSRALDIYLMNADGVTIASSNFDKSHSFVGKNFGFRPYFQQAKVNGSGQYYAVGTNSGARGYYFSAAVTNEQRRFIGVVVVKMSVGPLETGWQNDDAEFMVTDRDGIIFMTSHSDWLTRTLQPLSQDKRREIQSTRRYPRKSLLPLENFSLSPLDQDFQVARLGEERYLVLHLDQPKYDWDVYLLVTWPPLSDSVKFALGLAALLLTFTGLLLFLLWKNQHQRRRYEQQTREELEIKVEERTRLLRHTQEELVQAAKMAALGQLSAAINHEINNPLSAIRTYADNAHQFLQRGQTEMAGSNLREITSLTERMAAITRQLKTFSRKSHGQIERCDLNKALDSALLIVQPKLSQTTVTFHQRRSPEAQWVRADMVWLEQILVNLFSNAMEAVDEVTDGQIWLSSEQAADNILIKVADNGRGISEEDMPHVFEAFFTTKSIGKGLGLGLSISYRLAKDMQGDLTVSKAEQGGAAFVLELRQDDNQANTNIHNNQVMNESVNIS